MWPSQDPDLPTAQPLARSPLIRGSGIPRQAPPLETPAISAEAGGSNRVPGALRNAGGRVGQGEGRGRAGRRRRGAVTDWPARRSEAVYGGWAGPPLQNKGQAARGAAAGRCLAPGWGANGQNASRTTPGPPESRARADRAWAGWALRTGPRTAERP